MGGPILTLACTAQLMVFMDALILNVALPWIRADFGLADGLQQWVVNAYTLPFTGFLLLGGRLADVIGRRRAFCLALAVFTIGSLLGGLAPTAQLLLAARAVQGLGAAVLAPATLTLVTTTFTDDTARARALGLWSATGSIGAAAGALLGGILTSSLGWRAVFLVNVPVGVLALVAALRSLPEQRPDRPPRLDLAGAVLATLGLTTVVYGVVVGGTSGWDTLPAIAGITLGASALAVFVLHEARWAREPLLPLRLLATRSAGLANLAMLFLGVGFFTSFYFISLYLQNVLGYSALMTGMCFLPQTLAVIVGARLAGNLLSGHAAGGVAACGAALAALGFGWLTGIDAHGSYLGDVCGPTIVFSLGIGLAFPAITSAATRDVPAAHAGVASGVFNTTRQVSGSLALAALSTVATMHTTSLQHGGAPHAEAVTGGYARAFLIASGFTVAAAMIALAMARTRTETPA